MESAGVEAVEERINDGWSTSWPEAPEAQTDKQGSLDTALVVLESRSRWDST